eukprot:5162305-Ditylum_brightwellii.AAC.1
MDNFRKDHSLTPANLRTLDHCHYILKVEHIYDITTSDSKQLIPCLRKMTPQIPNYQMKQLVFPNQGKLPKTAWNLWHKAIINTICNNREYLKIPLGKWTHNYKKWKAYHYPVLNAIYQHNGHQWNLHYVNAQTRSTIQASKVGQPITLPSRHQLNPITDLEKATH